MTNGQFDAGAEVEVRGPTANIAVTSRCSETHTDEDDDDISLRMLQRLGLLLQTKVFNDIINTTSVLVSVTTRTIELDTTG